MALKETYTFWRRKYKMGCLIYKTAGFFTLQALHWTVGKYLIHPCHPITVVTLDWKTRNFQGKKKILGILGCYGLALRERRSLTHFHFICLKLKSKIIYKQINITWHTHILLSIINYLGEHTGFNIYSTLTRMTFISPFIIPL